MLDQQAKVLDNKMKYMVTRSIITRKMPTLNRSSKKVGQSISKASQSTKNVDRYTWYKALR